MLRILGIIVSSLCVCFGIFSGVSAQTQDRERLVITTYYPSPYGSYNELRAKRMAIGDNYINAATAGGYGWGGGYTNNIDANVDLVVEGRVGVGSGMITPAASLHVINANTTAGQNGLWVNVASTSTATSALNISANGDSKLIVRGDGSVGIGTVSPSAPLHINSASNGAIRIVDGTQAADKVLTSDASGTAIWKYPPLTSWQVLGTTDRSVAVPNPPPNTYAIMPDMSIQVDAIGGDYLIMFAGSLKVSSGGADVAPGLNGAVFGDGSGQPIHHVFWSNDVSGTVRPVPISFQYVAKNIPANSVLNVMWAYSFGGATLTSSGAHDTRVMTVIKLKSL